MKKKNPSKIFGDAKKKKIIKAVAKYLIELLITIIGVLFGFWLNKTFGFSLKIVP